MEEEDLWRERVRRGLYDERDSNPWNRVDWEKVMKRARQAERKEMRQRETEERNRRTVLVAIATTAIAALGAAAGYVYLLYYL